MRTETIPLEKTQSFSPFFIDYINQKEELKPFYSAFPSVSNFKQAIENRAFPEENRIALVNTLKDQYQDIETSDAVRLNIDSLLDAKTFTVTTGHQLNLCTGPLYFIYKIISVINACKTLRAAYPEYQFVPVYWMASEDHDFDEINHFYFGGKKYAWETDQSGAVGHFDLDSLSGLLDQLPDGVSFFKKAYTKDTLADAVRDYVNYLFGEEGLVIVDADASDLKRLFTSVIEDDLFQHQIEKIVTGTSAELAQLGYKTQVNAREINFFFLEDGIRERIERKGDEYVVLNSDQKFSAKEMRELIQNRPECLSPNVILRPLYQETILPNLAYIGGPSEAIYWLQLKGVFDHFNTAFPMLMPRNFGVVVPEATLAKWDKTGLAKEDLFLKADAAFEKWVKANSDHDLSFDEELKELEQLEDQLKSKVTSIDQSLNQHIEAIHQTFSGKIKRAEKKLLQAEKRLHADRLRQIETVKEVLFPGGTLQERRDNMLNFYLKDPTFISKLLQTFDAFRFEMYLLYE